jgi:pimeloyl-ACP methyl ester carboxylesterase
MNRIAGSIAALALGAAGTASAAGAGDAKPTIVLVHGAFVDGSGWQGVYRILRDAGHAVVVLQHSTASLTEDVAVTRRAIAACPGDVVLVGHSYGGVIITEAGNDPKVSALVYVAAFAPDAGESVASISASAPKGSGPPILPIGNGFLVLDTAKFREAFAADVTPDIVQFMADAQLPWGARALEEKISEPAWKHKPSWYLVPAQDRMIPPDAQRGMAARAGAKVQVIDGSHAVYVANPVPVAAWILQAAQSGAVVALQE